MAPKKATKQPAPAVKGKDATNGKSSSGQSGKTQKKPSGRSGTVLAVSVAVCLVLGLAAFLLVAPSKNGDGEDAAPRPAEPTKPASAKAAARVEEGSCAAGDSSCATKDAGSASANGLSWKPKTLSVILPCAGEGQFAAKTVESVAKSVPGGIGGGILSDIVVVDDGSDPPLEKEHLTAAFQKKYPITIVRHQKAIGLMGAKSAGAAAAIGDVLVFYDCHVAPQGDWYKKFLKASAENYRRIVVPVITDLDIDTWKETRRGAGLAKCYLTWDADFKWVNSPENYMPVLSGGLLGISRRWWNETGGYDAGMRGWGGENVDQSLRTWLCGGEIVNLPNAYVAHMWRKPEDRRTEKNYEVNDLDPLVNKARAILAWFGDFEKKSFDYPALSYVGLGDQSNIPSYQRPNPKDINLDVSELHALRDRLQCRPFAWFLWRFREIYWEGGLLPQETFQLQELRTKLCLTFIGPIGTHPQGHGFATLLPCNQTGLPGHLHPEPQRWHHRNQDPATGKCCNGMGSWNTDQCATMLNREDGMLQTHVCDVAGRQGQEMRFVADDAADTAGDARGQLKFMGGCLVANPKETTQLGRGMDVPKLKVKACKKEKKGVWRKMAAHMPIETRLYTKALAERPEIFH